MISPFNEVRRRLVWLWRLSNSSLSMEMTFGHTPAIWVFDSQSTPDGYALRPHIETLAESQQLELWSFGPRSTSVAGTAKFIRHIPSAFFKTFETTFASLVTDAVEAAHRECSAVAIVSGSFNGTFGKAVGQKLSREMLWEVQHGFLDAAYFPLSAGRFFARAQIAEGLIRQLAPDIDCQRLGLDLDPPEGEVVGFPAHDIRSVRCFSKNPGGGCSHEEVRLLEEYAHRTALGLGAAFNLYLHPRDSILKLILRHKSLRMIAAVRRSLQDHRSAPALVISSYSTALATRSRPGDYVLNAEFGTPDFVRAQQYGWLPAVPITADVPSRGDPVFRRNS